MDTANGINYATNAHYAPQGALASLTNGANLNSTFLFNSRLQPCWIYATTGTPLPVTTLCNAADPGPGNILDLSYGFVDSNGHNNGNVIQITNNLNGNRSQQFTYDVLNRLLTAQTPSGCTSGCWSQGFSYDAWANLSQTTATGIAPPMGPLTAGTNNRVTSAGFNYDAAGNETTDVTNSYAWNAEGEIKTANGVNYTHDGDGNRVEKANGKIYWYGAGSEILDESDLSGNITDEYAFFGGKRIAHRDASGNLYYYAEDMLGSSRVIATSSGTVCYDADFYPFGGEHAVTSTCSQNYKFEGKERDAETGNDDFGARYYSSVYGRWLSADWSAVPVPVPYANLTNPQTLNLYAMVRDNPETFADLDGHVDNTGGQINSVADLKDNVGPAQPIPYGIGEGQANYRGTEAATAVEAIQMAAGQVAVAQQQNVPMSKSTYKTATEAATAALDATIGQSEKSGWEYAGRVVKLANGRYAYTLPTTEQSSTTSDPDGGMKEGTRIPAGTTDAGMYHTHPTSCATCAHDQFSGADNALAVREHLPSYIESGATRSIYLLDGSKRTSILDPTPPTVIRYGPPQ